MNKMLKAKSRIVNRPSISKGKKYDKIFVYLPQAIVTDSAYPFDIGDIVIVSIDTKHQRLIIEKVKYDEK